MRSVLLHGHIFKNAGTTLDWSLQRSFSDGFVDHRQDDLMRAEGAQHLAELVASNPGLQAVSSHHMPRGLCAVPELQWQPVYLLRHPFARMRSAYDFEKQQAAETPGSRAAKNKSFRDYVEWRMGNNVSRTIRNYQTLYLAGRHGRSSNAKLAFRYFNEAIETLRAVPTVGLVERYDESMVVLEHSLQPQFPTLDLAYVAQNQSRRARSVGDAGLIEETFEELGSLRQRVTDENAFDLALYQIVNARLQSQIERIADFESRLGEFRHRCQNLLPAGLGRRAREKYQAMTRGERMS